MCTLTVERFVLAVKKRLADMEQNDESYSSVLLALQAERDKHRADAERIVDALVEAGHSTALITRLAASELKMTELQRRIDSLNPPDVKVTVAEIRDYFDQSMADFKSLVRQAFGLTRAKRELAKHISKLILTPRQTDGAWTYEISGDWKLLPDEKCVIWLVARDGIEPPTPAFSGPRSTTELSGLGIPRALVRAQGVSELRE
jgi:hypothetical protein